MSSYIEQSLAQGEHFIYLGHISLWSFFTNMVVAVAFFSIALTLFYFKRFLSGLLPQGVEGWLIIAIASMVPALLGGLKLLIVWIRYKTTEFGITNKRVIIKKGWINREVFEINLSRIESMNFHQNIFERVFNLGDLVIYGSGEMQSTILDIHNPMAFRKAFIQAQSQASVH